VGYGDVRDEWRLTSIERKFDDKADKHEIYSIRSTVDSLEHSLREACSDINGLRSQLQTLQEAVEQLQRNEMDRLEREAMLNAAPDSGEGV
jgi:hypothetical protein